MTNDDRPQEGDEERIVELDNLRRGVEPPGSLEDRTVRALRQEGLIREPRGIGRSAAWVAGSLAAALFLVAIGWVAGRLTAPAAPGEAGETFALLLRSGDSPETVDERAEAILVEEYSGWARTIAESGRLVDGQKLDDESRLLRTGEGGLETRAALVTSEPHAVQGYFLIRADGYEEAARIASGCPHLKHGGAIEIRRIDRR